MEEIGFKNFYLWYDSKLYDLSGQYIKGFDLVDTNDFPLFESDPELDLSPLKYIYETEVGLIPRVIPRAEKLKVLKNWGYS